MAQVITPEIRAKRVEYLSRSLKITSGDAEKLLALDEETTRSLNRIYHDSTLNSTEKISRMQKIKSEKLKKQTSLLPKETLKKLHMEAEKMNFGE